MVLLMENKRRSFDRLREPVAKKPRQAEEPIRGVNTKGRPFPQRPSAPGTNPVAQRLRGVDRDSEGDGGYKPQSLQEQNQELVDQYRTALAELTFNSKPIITNLTIIAGENLHAAKAIAATICSNIIEAPSDQKLPSLYLLDSIVKNIARDYIRYFGARLPEVFCKAYRQVDPPVHQSMRHLFGTWKGVFPLQPLQAIEKELGFASANGSSTGAATSRPESQSQRTPHSIHVNPKYLERQRLEQSSRAKGMTNAVTGAIANSMEDIEKPSRSASISAGRPWVDSPLKLHSVQRRDALSEPVHEKNVTGAYGDYEYESDPPRNSGFGIGRTSGRVVTDQGLEKPWFGTNSAATETKTSQRNGFEGKHGFPKSSTLKAADPRSRLLSAQSAAGRISGGITSSWKNSEEEEFMWDDMNSRLTDHGVANISNSTRKGHWTPDESERLGIESRLQRPQTIHDMGSRFNREIPADSLSSEQKDRPPFAHRMLSSLPLHDSHLMDEQILSQTVALGSGHLEGFSPTLGGLRTTPGSSIARTRVGTQLGSSHVGSSAGFLTNAAPRTGATMGQRQLQSQGASPPSGQSPMHQNPPSPSRSNPQNQYIPDTLIGSLQKLQSQELLDSSHLSTSHQLRKNYPFSQQLHSAHFSSDQPQKSPLPKGSNLGTSLKLGSSAPNHSSSLASEISGQSSTGRVTAAKKSGVLSNNSISASPPSLSFKEKGQIPSQSGTQPLLPGRPPPSRLTSIGPQVVSASSVGISFDNSSAPTNTSQRKVEQPPLRSGPPPSSLDGSAPPKTSDSANPFSFLLSSLVSKGLISASKKEPSTIVPPTHLQNESPGISSTSSDIGPVYSDVPAVDEVSLSEPAAKSSALPEPATTAIESLIGFEFKPDVLRELHPSVISGLFDDFPHQCSECGIRLKFEEQFDKHLEWHALKKTESLGLHMASRKWFVHADNWVSGYVGFPDAFESAGSGDEEPAETQKREEPMVPADESQNVCLLCGELFEDYYSIEKDAWMFSGAVYMSIPSCQGTINDKAALGPIVHANCISESSVLDLGLTSAIKMEVDT